MLKIGGYRYEEYFCYEKDLNYNVNDLIEFSFDKYFNMFDNNKNYIGSIFNYEIFDSSFNLYDNIFKGKVLNIINTDNNRRIPTKMIEVEFDINSKKLIKCMEKKNKIHQIKIDSIEFIKELKNPLILAIIAQILMILSQIIRTFK